MGACLKLVYRPIWSKLFSNLCILSRFTQGKWSKSKRFWLSENTSGKRKGLSSSREALSWYSFVIPLTFWNFSTSAYSVVISQLSGRVQKFVICFMAGSKNNHSFVSCSSVGSGSQYAAYWDSPYLDRGIE